MTSLKQEVNKMKCLAQRQPFQFTEVYTYLMKDVRIAPLQDLNQLKNVIREMMNLKHLSKQNLFGLIADCRISLQAKYLNDKIKEISKFLIKNLFPQQKEIIPQPLVLQEKKINFLDMRNNPQRLAFKMEIQRPKNKIFSESAIISKIQTENKKKEQVYCPLNRSLELKQNTQKTIQEKSPQNKINLNNVQINQKKKQLSMKQINNQEINQILQNKFDNEKNKKINISQEQLQHERLWKLEHRIPQAIGLLVNETAYKKEMMSCQICCEQHELQKFVTLPCLHSFDQSCLSNHFQNQLNSNVFPISCLKSNCKEEVQIHYVQGFLAKDLIEKYFTVSFNHYMRTNADLAIYCPQCNTVYEHEPSATTFHCTACNQIFCLQCREFEHPQITCEDNQKENKEFFQLADEEKFKKCPGCKFWIARTQGCNHMTCLCLFQFCYECGMEYTACICQEQEE